MAVGALIHLLRRPELPRELRVHTATHSGSPSMYQPRDHLSPAQSCELQQGSSRLASHRCVLWPHIEAGVSKGPSPLSRQEPVPGVLQPCPPDRFEGSISPTSSSLHPCAWKPTHAGHVHSWACGQQGVHQQWAHPCWRPRPPALWQRTPSHITLACTPLPSHAGLSVPTPATHTLMHTSHSHACLSPLCRCIHMHCCAHTFPDICSHLPRHTCSCSHTLRPPGIQRVVHTVHTPCAPVR